MNSFKLKNKSIFSYEISGLRVEIDPISGFIMKDISSIKTVKDFSKFISNNTVSCPKCSEELIFINSNIPYLKHKSNKLNCKYMGIEKEKETYSRRLKSQKKLDIFMKDIKNYLKFYLKLDLISKELYETDIKITNRRFIYNKQLKNQENIVFEYKKQRYMLLVFLSINIPYTKNEFQRFIKFLENQDIILLPIFESSIPRLTNKNELDKFTRLRSIFKKTKSFEGYFNDKLILIEYEGYQDTFSKKIRFKSLSFKNEEKSLNLLDSIKELHNGFYLANLRFLSQK